MAQSFKSFLIKRIPQCENARYDALNKLASTSFDHLNKKVLVEILPERNIDNKQVDVITIAPNWTIPFTYYLLDRILPNNPT